MLPCPGIRNTWENGDAWFRCLSRKSRNNYTRGRRILGKLGGEVSLRVVDPAGEDIAPVLDHVLALKRAWLRANEPRSTLLGPCGDRLRAALDASAATGLMRVFLLTCGDKVCAASVNFVYPTRLQAYLTSYAPEFERGSPGTDTDR